MEDVTRRGFITALAAGAVTVPVTRVAGASEAVSAGSAQGGETVADAASGEAEGKAKGAYLMSEDEAMARLLDEPVVEQDYVQADGTVVPAVYLMLRNRFNRMGIGMGSNIPGDGAWDWLMEQFSEDDAQHVLDMPLFEWFTAFDYAQKNDADPDESEAMLADLASRGLIGRAVRAGVAHYHVMTGMYGVYETFATTMDTQFNVDFLAKMWGADDSAGVDYGTPMYHSVPVNTDVVAEQEGALPYDDWRAVIARNPTLAVAPCVCRTNKMQLGRGDPCDHPIETCISCGEEAEYYIENGFGRQITQDEACEIIQNAVDQGMVVDHLYSKAAESMCLCHSDCCMWLGSVRAANGEGDVMAKISNYDLVYDKDTCIRCGACIERCPMQSVSFGDDGFCVMDKACVHCGQCCTVCPVGARSLVAKAPEDRLDLPDDKVGDYLEKAKVRMAKGYIKDFVG